MPAARPDQPPADPSPYPAYPAPYPAYPGYPPYPGSYPPPASAAAPPPYPPYTGFPPPPGPTRPPRPPIDRAALVQKVLLAAGVLCVLAASAVFLAVGWHRFGVAGQTAIVAAVTSALAALSVLLQRRGLRMSAEAIGIATLGLMLFDVLAIHRFDVAGAAHVRLSFFLAAAYPVLALLLGAMIRIARGLRSYPVACVWLLGLTPSQVVQGLRDVGHPVAIPTFVGIALVLAGAFVVLGDQWRAGTPAAATGAYLMALAWAIAMAARGIEAVSSAALPTAGLCVALLGIAGVAGAVAAWPPVRPNGWLEWIRVGAPAVGLFSSVVALAVLAGRGGQGALTGAAAALALAGIALALRPEPPARWAATVAGGLEVLVLVATLAMGPGTDQVAWQLLLGCAVATASAARRAETRAFTRTVAAISLPAAVVIGSIERAHPALWITFGIAASAAVTAVAAAGRRYTPDEQPLGLIAALSTPWMLVAGVYEQVAHTAIPLIAVLAAGGAVLAGYAALPRRGWLAAPAAAAFTASFLDAVHAVHSPVLETRTVPLAVLVGAACWYFARDRAPNSWERTGAALIIGFGPSTIASLSDPDSARILLTLAAAVLIALAGVALRMAAPLLVGAAVAAALALSQLAPYASGLPRWLTLGAAGAVLLGLGIGFEWTRRGAKAAARWFGELS